MKALDRPIGKQRFLHYNKIKIYYTYKRSVKEPEQAARVECNIFHTLYIKVKMLSISLDAVSLSVNKACAVM